jgi:hypothetical protein
VSNASRLNYRKATFESGVSTGSATGTSETLQGFRLLSASLQALNHRVVSSLKVGFDMLNHR